jgi:hypothetical protein
MLVLHLEMAPHPDQRQALQQLTEILHTRIWIYGSIAGVTKDNLEASLRLEKVAENKYIATLAIPTALTNEERTNLQETLEQYVASESARIAKGQPWPNRVDEDFGLNLLEFNFSDT